MLENAATKVQLVQPLGAEAPWTELSAPEQMLLIPAHQRSPASQMSLLNEQLLRNFSSCAVGHPRSKRFKKIFMHHVAPHRSKVLLCHVVLGSSSPVTEPEVGSGSPLKSLLTLG